MNKNILRKTIGIFIMIIMLSTCDDELKLQEQHDKAVVSFLVTDSTARTVFPQVSLDDVVSYKLLGGRNGATETELLDFSTLSTSLTLDVGTWNFTLNAYNGNGQLILQGVIQNRQITLTGNNQISFTLSGIKSGTGDIQITLNFPVEAGITRISTNGDVSSENFTSISNGNFEYTKNTVNAGDYIINFELHREDVLRAVVSELVLVRNNLTSSKTITLIGENLKPLPSYGIEIELVNMNEWVLTEQAAQAIPNTNKTFSVTGSYTTYQWYLDGISVGTASSYTFNKPVGVYQLVLVVTNSTGESRSGRCRVTVAPSVEPITGIIFSEDFEGTNSFTIVNGTQTNQWWVGTAAAYGGTKSAYISNNSGTSNAYNINTTSVVHMHRNVTFPTSSTPFTLTFYWRAQGESTYDYLTVHLVESSTTPTAGSTLATGTQIGATRYNLGGTGWNQASINIPSTNSGTTKRLVFTWVNDSSQGTTPPVAIDNVVLTGEITSTAEYTITFNSNSGTGTVPITQTVNAGSSIILPNGNGLTRSGFTFGGWNTNTSGTGINYNVGSAYLPTGNVTLYARWLSNYTITFNANGATGTPPVSQIVSSDSSITLPGGSGLTRDGFVFGGWNTNTSGTGTNYDASTTYASINGNVTLYARWLRIYTITFNVNNGTGTAPVIQTVNEGSGIIIPNGNGLSRTGYTFNGWNTNTTGTGTNYDAGVSYFPTGTTSAITLYARWSAITYTITYNINGGTGTVPTVQTVTAGNSVTLSNGSGLTKTGFTFGGWNTNTSGTGTSYSASSSYTPTGNITLYALWNTATTQLTANVWANGTLSTSTSEDWYSFLVTNGTTYRIWWNDAYEGSGKTGDLAVSARYSGSSSWIFGGTDTTVDSGYNTAQSFTATQSGTVEIRVIPYSRSSQYIGTYGLVYSTGTTRPAL